MGDKDLTPGDSLAFLSANRAPGKRQIRVVNREELTSSLVMIGAGSDDEDDDDYGENQEGDDNSSDVDSSEDNSEAANSDTDSDEEEGDDDEDEDDGNGEEDGKKQKRPRKAPGSVPDDDDDDDDMPEEISNSVDADMQNSGVSTPREQPQDLAQVDVPDSTTAKTPVCSLCLNFGCGESEVIQCDNCGLTVHEGCYGIGDDGSEPSEDSMEATEPWFCEPCLAGQKPDELSCELCPVKGGVLKRTDYGGNWVHLLCALYVSGCAFGDVERLSPVCLFDVGYSRFGSKSCAGCQKQGNRLAARTGICSKCDAGMCKVFYHITCAQKAGLLVSSVLNTSLESAGEHGAADPYFLCCPIHSDRQAMQMKVKRFQMLERQKSTAQKRILTPREERVLAKRRESFARTVASKGPHWVPTTEKWQRLLPTSSKFFAKMGQKAELLEGITRDEWEGEFRVSFNANMLGKFANMPPAFSADFVLYFTEREKQMPTIRSRVDELAKSNSELRTVQETLKDAFDKADQSKHQLDNELKEDHGALVAICSQLNQLGCNTVEPPKPLVINPPPSPINGVKKSQPTPSSASSMSKRNMANGSIRRAPANQRNPSSSSRSTPSTHRADEPPINVVRVRQCAECEQSHDQHLMAHCDTCGKHYHIGCLDPPLTKLPKKTSLYGWECSKCFDKSSDSSDVEADVNAPRQLRVTRKPVVRFTSDDVDDSEFFLNGTSPLRSRSSASKRKSTSDSPSAIKKQRAGDYDENSENHKERGTPSKKPKRSGNVDHSSIARTVNKAVVDANITECVAAVVERAKQESSSSKGRVKTESVAKVGLEDEKDDESGSSQGSVELHVAVVNGHLLLGTTATVPLGLLVSEKGEARIRTKSETTCK